MDASKCFVQDNYYYLCETESEAVRQNLDAYEAQETYTLEYVTPLMAIQKNRSVGASPYNPMMFEREASVTSQKNRISVGNENMPPEIVSIPSDLTVEQGDLAEIRCVAKTTDGSELSLVGNRVTLRSNGRHWFWCCLCSD